MQVQHDDLVAALQARGVEVPFVEGVDGGRFAWINSATCVIRVNREGAEQIGEVLKRQGVELIVIDLVGYDIHGAINRTLDRMAKQGLSWAALPYDKMQLNGGGIHCSTTPLIRDPV
jgi:N-dimethylarginine dimethylaminohydrolase